MRCIIPSRSVNAGDLRSFGIHPMVSVDFDGTDTCASGLGDPDLSDTVDVAELEAINRSLSAHAAEIEDFTPRRSYKMSDYLPVPTKPVPPACAMRLVA